MGYCVGFRAALSAKHDILNPIIFLERPPKSEPRVSYYWAACTTLCVLVRCYQGIRFSRPHRSKEKKAVCPRRCLGRLAPSRLCVRGMHKKQQDKKRVKSMENTACIVKDFGHFPYDGLHKDRLVSIFMS